MTKTMEPTPEEHAYHLGWTAYFNEKFDGVPMENPFLRDDSEENNILYDKWNAGWLTAQVVATSMEDV